MVSSICLAVAVLEAPIPPDQSEIKNEQVEPDRESGSTNAELRRKRQVELVRLQRHAERELSLSDSQSKKRSKRIRQKVGADLFALGLLYLDGVEVEPEPQLANTLFVRSVGAGYQPARLGQAWCLLDGCGKGPNLAAFNNLLKRIARIDPGKANYLQFLKLSSESIGDDDALPPGAKRALEKAAQLSDPQALNEKGLFAVEATDLDQALRFFEKAAALGSLAAASNVSATRLQLGKPGLNSKDPEHQRQIPRSQRQGPEAQFEAAKTLHRVAQSPAQLLNALQAYKRAAAAGSKRAGQMVALIVSRPAPAGGINLIWMRQIANVEINTSGDALVVPPASFSRDVSPLSELIPALFRDAS